MDDDGRQRRLSAILIADVAGYTRLIEQDTDGTVAAWQLARAEVIDPAIAEHSGRVVKLTGDGFLAEFPTVLQAVTCAISMQEQFANSPLDFRMGVNLGDIVDDGEDIHGEGVNIAARIEGLAEPGGICISGGVYDQVRNRLEHGFDDMGEHVVKHVSAPVRVYGLHVEIAASGPAQMRSSDLALPDKPSIAVLPFDNMSGDPEQEYFSDGIAEDIITALSRIRWFFVIARNSTFAYKGKSPDVRQVGKDLGVRYVLEGSVRKGGNRVRISAQLIDAATGNHLWAERYDRALEDVFAVQDEITQTIIGAIEPELGSAERERALRKPLDSLDAWDTYQQGMLHLHRRTKQDLDEAQRLFGQAIELDPNLVPAYSASAEGCFFQIVGGFTDSPEERRDTGLIFGRRAVELDKQDAGAHYALGRIHTVRREHELAIPEMKKALKLNPSYAWAHYWLGMVYGTSGRPKEAIAPIEVAMRLSPNDPYMGQFMVHLGEAYLFMRRHEEALDWAEKSLREPNIQWSRYALLVSALGHLNREDEAARAIADLLRLRPEITVTAIGEWWPISDADSRAHLLDGLRKASAAAAVAAMAACWDEACEGLARAHGRPGLHAIPPALALGLANGATLAGVLAALVVGYEVGGRAGAAVRLGAGLHVDGTWGLFGAAAVAAHMMAGDAGEARALVEAATGIAACQAPQSLYLPVAAGATARNTYAAHAVATGIHLAAGAYAGITSPDGALDEWARRTGAAGVETPALAGPGEWLILEGYLKPFAAARHVHYGAQAVLDWRGRGGEWGAIETLRLATYGEALAYCGNRAPASAIQAQFSLSFGLAWAAVHGGLGPDAYTAAALRDRDVRRLEALADIRADDAAYPPGKRGARLTVGTKEGEQIITVDVVAGDPRQPMTAGQVREKFLSYAAPALGPAAENMADAILQGPPDAPIAECLGVQGA